MQIAQNQYGTWFIVQRKALEFVGKEASKFGNSCKWVWWTDCAAFGWQFILSMCSCRAERHQPSSTGLGTLMAKAHSLVTSGWESKSGARLRRGEAMPVLRRTGAEFPKTPGDNALNWRNKRWDFPGRKKRLLEAGFSGVLLIGVRSEILPKNYSNRLIFPFF